MSAYDFVAYDQVKIRLSEAEAEEWANHNARFRALWLVGSSDSDNPVFTEL